MPQCYVIRKFLILLLFYLATLSITTVSWVCGREQECDYGTLVEYSRRKQKMSVKQPHYPPKTAHARPCYRTKVFAMRSLAYWNPNVKRRIHNSKTQRPILRQIQSSMPLFCFWFSDQTFIRAFVLCFTQSTNRILSIYVKKGLIVKCKTQPRVNSFYVKQFSI
jgi:hypothetical protein